MTIPSQGAGDQPEFGAAARPVDLIHPPQQATDRIVSVLSLHSGTQGVEEVEPSGAEGAAGDGPAQGLSEQVG